MKRIDTYSKFKGAATILPKDGKYKIKFLDAKTSDKIFVFPGGDMPFPIVAKGQFYVEISAQDEELLTVRPLDGLFKAKFVQFVAKENELPAPKQNPAGTGTTKDGKKFNYDAYQSMIALIKLIEWGDAIVPLNLRYYFAKDAEGNAAVSGGGKHSILLESFMEAVGIYDQDFAWRENLLPTIQKAANKANEVFYVRITNGYISEFSSGDGDIEDDDDLGDELEEETLEGMLVKQINSEDEFAKGAYTDDDDDL